MTNTTFTHPDERDDDHPGYQTADGCEARVYATDAEGTHPIHGAIKYEGQWDIVAWTKTGRFFSEGCAGDSDLIDKPRTITRWVNVYEGNHIFGAVRSTREEADRLALPSRVACKEITVTVGEGL